MCLRFNIALDKFMYMQHIMYLLLYRIIIKFRCSTNYIFTFFYTKIHIKVQVSKFIGKVTSPITENYYGLKGLNKNVRLRAKTVRLLFKNSLIKTIRIMKVAQRKK